MNNPDWNGANVPERVRVTRLYTAFEDTYDRGFYFDGESHPFFELVYVESGAVGAASGGDVFTLHPGQMILHAPMVFHRIWAAQNTTPTVLIFSFSASNLTPAGGIYLLSDDNQASMRPLLAQIRAGFHIVQEYLVAGLRDDSAAALAANQLERLLLSVTADAAYDARDLSVPAQHYREIMAVMDAHLHESLTVPQLAALCRMSESTLKKNVARYAGQSVMRCFTEMKIRRAAQLLAQGVRINRVADEVGFTDPNYFSTVFRRITGKAPSQYRSEVCAHSE